MYIYINIHICIYTKFTIGQRDLNEITIENSKRYIIDILFFVFEKQLTK